jgi:hypothetical protein
MAMLSDMFGADGQQSQPSDMDPEFLRVLAHNAAMLRSMGYEPGQRESSNVEPLTGGFLGIVDGTGAQVRPAGSLTPEQIMRAMPRHWPGR